MIEDIINSQSNYDKEAYKQKKKEQLESAYRTIDESVNKIKTDSSFFKEYLDVQSKFDVYSSRNALLIASQLPNAIQLKDYKSWKEENALFKTKYPKRIIILEPSKQYITKDGKRISNINAKEVIDISETNQKVNTKSIDKKIILQALLHECPVEIKAKDSLESGKVCEWNTDDKVIYVAKSDDYDLTIGSIANELVKINLYEDTQEFDEDKSKCIGYMLCKKYGIDVSLNNAENMINRFKDMESKDVLNELTSMKEIYSDINSRVSQYIDDKKREVKNREQER
ncbi:MAG: hypothetical protein ACI4VL_00550 [Bacilli bacterium]